ncbi:MAG: polyprenol phosphomannose-dependent alpha 1,6 mannosyltransferase MptB [Acidimicrobiales bacterium]
MRMRAGGEDGSGRLAPAAPSCLRRYAAIGLAATTAVVAGAVVGGSAFVSEAPGSWLFGTPGAHFGSLAASGAHPPVVAMLCVYGGLILLAATWWRLVRALDTSRGVAVSRVVVVLVVWAIPLLLAPPLFSRDAFSYAGQGEMVSHHIDPYRYGTGVLGATPFDAFAGPLWATTPSPYGPVFLFLDGLVTVVTGHHELADLVLLRLLAVAGVALMVAGLPTLARRLGRDPASVVVLGAGSPLVLVALVGGDHNDALMVGLLVAGLAVASRVGPVPGLVLCALAAGVKAPALLGAVFIGWNWAPAGASAWRRARRTVESLAVVAAVMAAASGATGMGWGWLGTFTAADKISTGVTPVDAAAHLVAWVAAGVGFPASLGAVRAVMAVAGLVVAAGAGAFLLWRSPRLGMVRALGATLLVLALLAPVLWCWYLTWGLVVLAPVAGVRLRRVVGAVTAVEVAVGAASVHRMVSTVLAAPLGDDLVLVAVLGAVALACLRWVGSPAPGTGPPGGRRLPYRSGRDRRSPWSGQRAVQPVGVTTTAIHRPHSAQ